MALTSNYDLSTLWKYLNGDRSHFFYRRAVEMYDRFRAHSEQWYPAKLIEERRPNEEIEVQEYRKKIYVAKTYPSFTRIVSSLGKIRRSSDWSIKYPDNADQYTKIADEETLEKYCEEDFPGYTSITNWVFAVLLPKYLTDPNAVILTMPTNRDPLPNEYLKPVPYIFDSCNVIDFVEGETAILSDPTGCWYTYKDVDYFGKAYYEVNREYIIRHEQTGKDRKGKGQYQEVWSYAHGLPMMPARKLQALVECSEGMQILYKSRIDGILPEFDEAIREYSDLQAGKVSHIYLERWEFSQNECLTCKGSGRRTNELTNEVTPCHKCEGHGYVAKGPYSKMVVRPQSSLENGGQNMPMPPAGYVARDLGIIKIMEESVANHIYEGLAAINFQFLDQTPLNQSGKAKEVDKEELNNTVHGIAEDIVRIMDDQYKVTAFYRYKNMYDEAQIKAMLPSAAVPDNYDLISAEFMQKELDSNKKAKLNPVILNSQEVEYCRKRFINEPEIAERLQMVLNLDPLPNREDETKALMLSNKGISLVNYVISCNINEFVQRAVDEDADFAKKKTTEQKAKMEEYAEAMIAENSTAAEVIGNDGSDINPDETATSGAADPTTQQEGSMATDPTNVIDQNALPA